MVCFLFFGIQYNMKKHPTIFLTNLPGKLYRTCLLWLLCAGLILTGCASRQSTAPGLSPDAPARGELSQKERTDDPASDETLTDDFDAFTEWLARARLSGNTLSLHYTLADPARYGLEQEEETVSLGTYSADAMKESARQAGLVLEQLKTFDTDQLDAGQQLTWKVTAAALEAESQSENFIWFSDILNPYSGYQCQLPVLLAEYHFADKKDVDTYLALLRELPGYFEQLAAFYENKAMAGCMPDRDALSQTVKQCRQLQEALSRTARTPHFLATTMDTRLAALKEVLTPEEIRDAAEQNRSILTDTVAPAYKKLADDLEALLPWAADAPTGLCRRSGGKEYYQWLLKSRAGIHWEPDQLYARLTSALKADRRLLTGNNTPAETNAAPASGEDTSLPEGLLKQLSRSIKKQFPPLEDPVACKLEYVDEGLEDATSPAFYLIPPIDTTDRHTIYLNKSKMTSDMSLYTTLAHEGFPGHLYQNAYCSALNLPLLRATFSHIGYSEGWATYSELYSYSFLDTEPRLAELYAAGNRLSLEISSILDMGIHYYGWDIQDVKDFLKSCGMEDDNSAEQVYAYICAAPANYLCYFGGYLEIMDIKEAFMEKMGADYTETAFHKAFLDVGDAPFAVVREALGVNQ